MNKELYGNYYRIPDDILKQLEPYSGNETVDRLLSTKQISYSQLKKIKHRAESGDKNALGGDVFINWVNNTLNSQRSGVRISNDTKAETGMETRINQSGKRDIYGINQMNRPSQSHHANNDDLKISEALKRINEIMSKII